MTGTKRVATPALAAMVLGIATLVPTTAARAADYSAFGGVGSWYGKAVQLCAPGSAPSACAGGFPAITMFVTSTLTADGRFVGDDSLQFGGPLLAPHTTANGQWFPLSSNQFIADYVFMAAPYPPVPNSVATFKARWLGTVVDESTILGFINIHISPTPVPLQWERLGPDQFPSFPPEAGRIVAPAGAFIFDAFFCGLATGTDCPLVFKVTLRRVGPSS